MREVERLADELFELVQSNQGFFFVSDGESLGKTKEQFFERVRGRLEHGREACRKMRAFLKKNDELAEPTHEVKE